MKSKIPYLMGLIATRSLNGEVAGIFPLVERARARIVTGVTAYDAVERTKDRPEKSGGARSV